MSLAIVPSQDSDHESRAGSGMSEMQDLSAEAPISSVLGVGQQLRLSRERKGLTAADVAKALKLSTRQVEALEDDDWQNLPGKTIIRGFVRNYARLLGLNSDLLMAALDKLSMPLAPELEMTVGTPVNISPENRGDQRDYVRVFSGMIILVLAVSAYFVFPTDLWQSTLSAIRAATQSNEVAREKEPVVVEEEAPAPEAVVAPPPAAVALADSSAVPDSSVSPAAEVLSSTTLKFSFTKPAWVEVRDRSGQVIYSKLGQAGSQREIVGQPPFTLVVGNATHVTLQYKGKPVDLLGRSKDDVARLTLE